MNEFVNETVPSTPSKGWQSRLIDLLYFVPPSVFMGLLIHIRQTRVGMESSFPLWILDTFIFWFFWWLLLPLLRFLARKWTERGKVRLQHIIYHTLLSIPLGFLNMAMSVYGSILVFGEDPGWEHFAEQYVPSALRFLPVSMLIYATITGMIVVANLRRNLREEQARGLALQQEAARAKLSALQGQVNPHFLFNTLNSLDVLIRSEKSQEASTLLHRLANLLRSTLQPENSSTHSLEEELQVVEMYLGIESIRFSDRLRIERKIDPGLLEYSVPVFSLQILVENAVRHGISRRINDGVVTLDISARGSSFVIIVEDNGPESNDQETQNSPNGIGLSNLRSRLNLLYHRNDLLSGTRTSQGTTRYQLEIPITSEPKEK